MAESFDIGVVGGGVVGLAIGQALLTHFPHAKVCVFEKEDDLGLHASGRNSGVIHAGFYYSPDSIKAQLTRRGNELLRSFCQDESVEVRACGKVVVATCEQELAQLDQLLERGRANGVELQTIDQKQLKALEPLASTVERAIWSPNSAVADPVQVVTAMARRFTRMGGSLALGTEVVAAEPGPIILRDGRRIACGHLVNAAGLYADRMAHAFGVGLQYRMLPFKGLYWLGDWPSGRLQRHIYSVPDARNPFLGVHLTVTVDGRVKVGPTAIPSLWREDYGGLYSFSLRESGEVARTFPQFLTSPHHDIRGLLRSELPKYSRRYMLKQASRLVPSVRHQDFTLKGRPGVRAQLFDTKRRQLEMDFVVLHGDRSTHILNAVSPAWTSSLAFAEYVVNSMRL